jgi:hypothetical protein
VNTDHVIGVAPVAVNVCVNGTPTVGAGTVSVVTTGAVTTAKTTTENGLSSVPAELVALTVNVDVPAVVDVPESTPAGDSVRPGGNVPLTTDQVIGVSPVAASVCVYAMPTVPSGSVAVVIDGAIAGVPYKALNVCPPKVFAWNV